MEHIQNIPAINFLTRINHLFDKQWFLLTCGDFEKQHFNTMTISWGSLGIMWNKPFAMVVVRPTRYTYGFMNQYNDFTLTAFPEQFRKDLSLLGSKSGRNYDSKFIERFLDSIDKKDYKLNLDFIAFGIEKNL